MWRQQQRYNLHRLGAASLRTAARLVVVVVAIGMMILLLGAGACPRAGKARVAANLPQQPPPVTIKTGCPPKSTTIASNAAVAVAIATKVGAARLVAVVEVEVAR